MSSLHKHPLHRVAHKSLQIGKRSKLVGEDMAAGIGGAGQGRG
jgi:hypothetical protein